MDKFSTLTGIAAPMPLVNIDTDMIIPKQFLKTIKRTGHALGVTVNDLVLAMVTDGLRELLTDRFLDRRVAGELALGPAAGAGHRSRRCRRRRGATTHRTASVAAQTAGCAGAASGQHGAGRWIFAR